MPIDTLEAEMESIVVTGFEGNRSLMETPGSISYINPAKITGFDESSLLFGLNTVAGVKMEERAPGSYRISIRGSSLRSPFGVRNVKVYWNRFPLTEPSGSTFLNLLDVTNMSDVEVIKGPSGSVYGAGNGGTLLIKSTPTFFSDKVSAGFNTGSFGRLDYNLGYHKAFDEGQVSFKYAESSVDGYREQSFLNRRVAEISGNYFTPKGEFWWGLMYSDLNYGIPGGLNLNQFNEDPSQARPGNPFVLGSIDANSSIDQQALFFGIGSTREYENGSSFEASFFGNFSNFENPFNLDYKIDDRGSLGGRAKYDANLRLRDSDAKFSIGYEFQGSEYDSRNYGNDYGTPDTLNFSDLLSVQTHLVFSSFQVDLSDNWFLTSSLSFNYTRYDIDRKETYVPGDTIGQTTKKFNPQLSPRIGLLKQFSSEFAAHASISFGFSPPTIEEVRTNEGSINLNLEPERGINYEIGVRGNSLSSKLKYDASLFFFRLNESIVQQQSNRGTTLFRNAGSTNQFGVELNTSYDIFRDYVGSSFLRLARLNVAYTYNHFRFNDYNTTSGDFSGNELTGVPPHILVSSFNLQTKPGLYFNLSHTFNDRAPLTDDNSVYSDSYNLVQSKLGWKTILFGKLSADAYFGMDNLLNEKYSLGYDINAFFGSDPSVGRYYQPAPERNWFLGLKINYSIKN